MNLRPRRTERRALPLRYTPTLPAAFPLPSRNRALGRAEGIIPHDWPSGTVLLLGCRLPLGFGQSHAAQVSPWAKRWVCQGGPWQNDNTVAVGLFGWLTEMPAAQSSVAGIFELGNSGGYCASISRVFSSRTLPFRAPVHLLKIMPSASMKIVVGIPKT